MKCLNEKLLNRQNKDLNLTAIVQVTIYSFLLN